MTSAAAFFSPPLTVVAALVVALAVVAALELMYRALFGFLARAVKQTASHLDDVLVRRMRLPAQVLVFLAGAHAFVLLRALENPTVSYGIKITELLLVSYLVIEAAETIIIDYWFVTKKQTEIPAVLRGLVLLLAYSTALITVVGSVTGVNLVPLLATSTVITVVMGLALQDTLGNLFAGVALSLDKPFAVGDWLMIDNVEGRVHMIGWRAVYLRTFSEDLIIIPSAIVAKARLHNFSRPQPLTCRNIEVLTRRDADPAVVLSTLTLACAAVPGIRPLPDLRVWLVGQTPLVQRYVVKVWIADFATHDQIESDVLVALVQALSRAGLAPEPHVAAVA